MTFHFVGWVEWKLTGIEVHATLTAKYPVQALLLILDTHFRIKFISYWEIHPMKNSFLVADSTLTPDQQYHVCVIDQEDLYEGSKEKALFHYMLSPTNSDI
jgi:hypothetical protein